MLSMRCLRPDEFLFKESLNRNLCDRRIVERSKGNLPEESGSQVNRDGWIPHSCLLAAYIT
jgi:hypothetical protein